jgi:hypothetical protein
MYVIEVAPLVRGGHLEKLSYYSAKKYPVGTLLDIPVRSKNIRGVVLDASPVSAAKTALRAATFSLRRLPSQDNARLLSPLIIETAKGLCSRVPASFGAVLFSLLPPEVQNGEENFISSDVANSAGETSVSVLTGTRKERWLIYKRLIREAFARRSSVVNNGLPSACRSR